MVEPEDGLTEKIRKVIREERESHHTDIKDTIRIYFNLGLIIIILSAFVGSAAIEAINQCPQAFSPGEQLIIIMLIGFAFLMGIAAWDIISGINIIEQKLKVLCDKKE